MSVLNAAGVQSDPHAQHFGTDKLSLTPSDLYHIRFGEFLLALTDEARVYHAWAHQHMEDHDGRKSTYSSCGDGFAFCFSLVCSRSGPVHLHLQKVGIIFNHTERHEEKMREAS